MAHRYREVAFTPEVLKSQELYFGRNQDVGQAPGPDVLTSGEVSFIEARDSFYLATVGSSGWPYLQHRGGAKGFLHVLSPQQLGFADYKGNRQMISTGNLVSNNRASLFLMDYPQRARLKILGHVSVVDARERPDLLDILTTVPERLLVERFFLIDVVGFDWNCPKYITPRYTVDEIAELTAPLRARIAELEKKLSGAHTTRREQNLP